MRTVELPPTIVPDATGRGAWLVHQDAIWGRALVRHVSADGSLDPVQILDGRFVVAGIDGPTPLLLSSDGTRLCVQPGNAASSQVHCRAVDAATVVAHPAGLWLLEQRPVAKGAPEGPPRKTSAKHPAGKPKPTQQRSKKRSGKGKDASQPVRFRLFVRPIDPSTGIAADAEDSELEFRRAMPGMALVDAVDNRRGAQLLWYEHARSVKAGRRRIDRARLRTGRLDERGRFVRSSRLTLFEGERSFGIIKGHLGPRLLGRDGRVIYAGRFVRPEGKGTITGFEARRIRPWGAITAAPVVFTVDPFRLTQPEPILPAEVEQLERIWAQGPSLAAGQPRFELEHVAWIGPRGYFVKDGQLHSAARSDGSPRAEPAPFVARRSRLRSVGMARDGEGLAEIPTGIVLLHADGSVEQVPTPGQAAAGAEARNAASQIDEHRPVRIGAAWWALRPRATRGPVGYGAVRLHPPSGDVTWRGPPLHPDTAVIVGGAPRGMLVQWHSAHGGQGRLALWQLAADGALRRLGEIPSPLQPGFGGVSRAGGGALLAGPSTGQPGSLTVLAIDGTGRVLGQRQLAWPTALAGSRLQALPAGGAWLTDRERTRVVWLDRNGSPRADRPWPTTDSGAVCLDGRPTRHVIPGPEPGRFVTVSSFARAGSCISGAPSWAPDGSLRWFGSTVHEQHSQAEVGLVAGASAGGSSAHTATPAAPSAATPASRRGSSDRARGRTPCPPDMVLVHDRLCIDRFEVHLVDAASGLPLSPDYPATPTLARITQRRWVRGRLFAGDLHAQAMPLPPLLRPQGSEPDLVARSRLGVRPSGYLTGLAADRACRGAGKRLCKPTEWLTACRGEQDRKFPYGTAYRQGACNVFRHTHPAAVLHRNPSVGHLDPRLNRVTEGGQPLLRTTGATPSCASRWGDDRIFDMVGNLDEWVADKSGAFAGGFYARATRAGCDAMITAHPRRYLDYSLGTRCCLDVKAWQQQAR